MLKIVDDKIVEEITTTNEVSLQTLEKDLAERQQGIIDEQYRVDALIAKIAEYKALEI